MTQTGKKRIVFLLSGYGAVRRGAEGFLEQLRAHLLADFDVTILGRGPAGEGVVHIRGLSRDNPVLNRLNRTPVIGHAMRFLHLGPLNMEWLTACLGSLPWLLRNDFDLFVPEGGLWGGWLGRVVRWVKRVPYVDIAHGAAGRWEVAAARRRPDGYVAMTQAALDDVRHYVPGLAGHVIPMAVDIDLFTPDAPPRSLSLPKPVFLCVGALEAMKRPHLAIDAVARAGTGSLVLVGDGPLAAEMDRLAEQKLGADRYLRISLSPEGMPSLYTACDVVTLPSETESFALVYVEAMACNRPVVTHDDAIRREIVGPAGIVCDTTDLEAYAAALRRAAGQDWGDAPRRRALDHGWDKVADAYRVLFKDLMAARRG